MSRTGAPIYRGDLYSDAALTNGPALYRRLRDLGPAVWLPRHAMWAVGRFEGVREGLRASDVLVSGQGVAANDAVNGPSLDALIADGEDHQRRRQVLIRPLMPAAMTQLRSRLEDRAERLVQGLAHGRTVEAMSELAGHLPLTVVAELVGLTTPGRDSMLRWASATFDALGGWNERAMSALPVLQELLTYIEQVGPEELSADSWAGQLFAAADRGDLTLPEARAMLIDYIGPSLDTTILAMGQMLWRLAKTPDALEQIRAEPGLVASVVNESVRLASPVRGFTRLVARDYRFGETIVRQGERVVLLFASANLDERHYERPEVFDLRRNPRDHVGWGHGPHVCVGMHLARLEMEVILQALARNVASVRALRPTRLINNVLQGFKTLPLQLSAIR